MCWFTSLLWLLTHMIVGFIVCFAVFVSVNVSLCHFTVSVVTVCRCHCLLVCRCYWMSLSKSASVTVCCCHCLSLSVSVTICLSLTVSHIWSVVCNIEHMLHSSHSADEILTVWSLAVDPIWQRFEPLMCNIYPNDTPQSPQCLHWQIFCYCFVDFFFLSDF